MASDTGNQAIPIGRRRLLTVLGTTMAAGLAGCTEGADDVDDTDDADTGDADTDGDADEGLGERVPPVVITYWSNVPHTDEKERSFPIVQENVEELGVEVEPRPMEFTSEVIEHLEGQYTRHFNYWYYLNSIKGADPNYKLERYHIARAGGTGTMNTANYANCEYSRLVDQQRTEPDPERRQELVTEAVATISHDAVPIPLPPLLVFGAARTDQVDPGPIGEMGINNFNTEFYVHTTPREGDTVIADTRTITTESTNYPVLDSTPALALWNTLVSSTLLSYDQDWELGQLLAEDYSIEDDGRTVTVEIKEDAEFHNGDPVTAEDVAFTFELLWSNPGSYPQVEVAPYESIEALDGKTVRFNLETAYPPLVTQDFPMWGILHRDTWEPASEDPDGFTPPEGFPGSGPFQLESFAHGQEVQLAPADTHPVYDPDHRLVLRPFRDQVSRIEAFRAGETDTAIALTFDIIENLEEEFGDDLVVGGAETFNPHGIFANYPVAPAKFFEFRDAVGKVIDRQLINEVTFGGNSYEPLHSTQLMRLHPYYPEDEDVLYQFTDDPAGDVEAARQTLADAGWGWDDDGQLHYPPDADLTPRWPEEGTPDPDEFECIGPDGGYTTTG